MRDEKNDRGSEGKQPPFDSLVAIIDSADVEFIDAGLIDSIEGIWTPTVDDVRLAESYLDRLDSLTRQSLRGLTYKDWKPARLSVRQYRGIVVGGRRQILINGFPPHVFSNLEDDDTIHPGSAVEHSGFSRDVSVQDGGASVWRALFNPTDTTFHSYQPNPLG